MSEQWFISVGPEITEGLHGTDVHTAFDIVKAGFSHDTNDELSLADSEDDYLARGHARKNADRVCSNRYAILRATFPARAKDEGMAGPPCIRMLGEEIAEVSVVGLAIYQTTDNRLIELYDEVALNNIRKD